MVRSARQLGFMAFLGLILVGAGRAEADLLFSTEIGFEASTSGSPTGIVFRYGESGDLGSPSVFGMVLRASDVGTTFAAQGGDPDFSDLASLMTNGLNNPVSLAYAREDGGKLSIKSRKENEVSFFQRDPAGIPDFAGSAITRITLTIDELSFTSSDDGHGDLLTEIVFRATFGVEGTTTAPEPSTLVLSLAAVIGFGIPTWLRQPRSGPKVSGTEKSLAHESAIPGSHGS